MFTEADLTRIYRQHVAMVRHRAQAMVRDAALCDDVTQETFLRFIDYAHTQPVHSPGALLYRIATNVALHRLRQRQRSHQSVPSHELSLAAAPPAVSAEDQMTLDDVLRQSPPEETTLALMYFVDGMSHDDIASVYGLSRRSVGYRLQSFCDRAQRLATKPLSMRRLAASSGLR